MKNIANGFEKWRIHAGKFGTKLLPIIIRQAGYLVVWATPESEYRKILKLIRVITKHKKTFKIILFCSPEYFESFMECFRKNEQTVLNDISKQNKLYFVLQSPTPPKLCGVNTTYPCFYHDKKIMWYVPDISFLARVNYSLTTMKINVQIPLIKVGKYFAEIYN